MSRSPDLPANIEAVYPLSPMQEGMLFHTLLAPSSGIYLMQNRYRLEGALHEREFGRAWEAVVARHPILRTSFAWKTQKRPLQVVHKTIDLPFTRSDLRELSPGQQKRRIAAELGDELRAGFDFGKAPLTRFRLFRLDAQSYEFVHSFHHILLDEWCTSLLMMDFIAHYQAQIAGETPKLAPARPYRDYIDWLGNQDQAATERFWRSYLGGFSSPTPLGLEPPSEPQKAQEDQEESQVEDLVSSLDAKSTAVLSELVQRHRLTLNTLVQGAWALLLSRYSGEPEVVFGVTVAGRPPELPEVDSIVGLFINTLPLRVRVPLEQPLLPWLGALLEQNLKLRQFEHTPLVDIQRWSELERGQPMFHSLFVFENAPLDPALRASRSFRVQEVRDRVHTNYPLTVMAWPDRELGLKISYDRARVGREAAARMLEHLRTLLESMAARSTMRLGDLTLLTAGERERALVHWNERTREAVDLSSFAARFQAQVRRAPRAIAATHQGRSISYAELNRVANRVAHALAAHGVGPEQRVALLDERGIELLVMMVAVFKAGAAYVPIEPSYPAARLAGIVALSEPRVLLTRARLVPRVGDALHISRRKAPSAPSPRPRDARDRKPGKGPVLLALEELLAETWSEADPGRRGGPDQLAYVIYTSGSTGVPKGAMVERRGMLNNMLSKVPRLGLVPGDVIAQTASPCFDISVWQHLTALLFGGTVEIVPEDVVRDPARLLEHVERSEIAVLELVPAVLQGMLEAARERPGTSLQRLRWVLPTGEALPVALARAWLEQFPSVALMNAYGPAECSDDVALHAITSPPAREVASIPIGRPVDQLELYVLDRALEPLPVGVSGELYVGGIGVGRGYLGDPRRTAEAFLPHPFGPEPGARLYRTGDLARYLPDGALEFAGRRDHQVKLRGLRIELGEIEARLSEHPNVREAAVLVREDRPGARRLVAYVVASEADQRAEELLSFLQTRLPEYMVPACCLFLSALPRTPNGKIDRKALPAPELGEASGQVAPRSESETKLAAIWAEVLGLSQVGVEDSFFALGGHSLQLTQVLARVRRVFEVEPSLRALFEAPTVAAQARAIEALQQTPLRSVAPPLRREADGDGPAPLSFAQERLWFLAQLEPSAASYNVPAAVRLLGELDGARLERCFAALVRRHESLRTRFVELDGRPSVRADAEPAALMNAALDLRSIPAEQRLAHAQALLEREAARPFDLTRGPLFRLSLLRVGEREHLLSIVLHHIISDGWSLGVMVRELSLLYADERAQLPPLPIQYADYARWQRGWLTGPVLDRQLAYWRDRLRDAPPALALPSDSRRPALRSYRGARYAFSLPSPLLGELEALAKQRGLTLYVVLLAGFELLLAHVSGQTEFCVGTPVANRTREELEGLIGLFVNTLVLRAELADDPSFSRVLERTHEQVLGAQAHQDLPFERLVQALRPTRNLGQTPLFQVMFSLQDRERDPLAIEGLALLPCEIDAKSAQFDLSLHMGRERDELSGSFEYSTDLFEPATIARIADHFQRLLEALVAQPALRLSGLPLPAWPRGERAEKMEPELDAPVQVAHAVGSRSDVEAELARIWGQVLGRAEVAAHENFFALGGDSILSLDVVARAKRAGLRVSVRQMFQHQTLRELAAAALADESSAASDQGPVTGVAPLLPIQRRFFARDLPNASHWNQSLLLQSVEPLELPALEAALSAILRHHDALRLRFVSEHGGCRAFHAEDEASPIVHQSDLSAAPEAERAALLAAHAARWQASLDLSSGPVLRAIVFELGAGEPSRLLLIAHHLVIDGVSWRILLSDLELAYEQARGAESIQLPDKTTSFKHWAERLVRAAGESALEREAQLWLALPWQRVRPIPLDDRSGDASEAALAIHDVVLPQAETRALLEQVPKAYRTRIEEVLLTALALALARWTGQSALAIELEGHGREPFDGEELDLSRTVGWLTSAYPVVLELSPHAELEDALIAVKEQLRRLPRRGLSYGVVRELGGGESAERLRALPAVEVAFNYLGQWDAVLGEGARFALASEDYGPEHDPRGALGYELEIDAAIYHNQLETSFRYSSARLRSETVQAIGALFRAALSQLIAHCLEHEAGAYTPSDFPEVALSASELGAILEQMD